MVVMKSLAVLCGLGMLSACATLPIPVEADVADGQKLFPELTLDTLHAGYKVAKSNCSKCHAVRMPWSETTEDWPAYIKKMGAKAKLSDADKDLVQQYMMSLSSGEGRERPKE